MFYRVGLLMSLMVVMVGCVHGTGQRMIPVERDYAAVEEVTECEANRAVANAHAVGAGLFAPYEYDSAEHYLAWGDHEMSEGDARGAWDFRGLAKMFAEEAIAKSSGIVAKEPMPVPERHEDCMSEYDRLVARYRELDPCKAKLIAPGPYAHIEAELSIAEHELMEKCGDEFLQAFRHLRWVEADIDAIWAKDTDGDGVTDMTDGEPWIAEDADGFQDEDGMPEPKPYPVLVPVLFKNDCAKLSDDAQGYLRGIAKMLLDGYNEVTVYIEAHADSNASDEYNMDLSQRRMESVKQALVANGAPNNVVLGTFQGESKPAADNATEDGRAKNRRVEIWLDSPDVTSPFCN